MVYQAKALLWYELKDTLTFIGANALTFRFFLITFAK